MTTAASGACRVRLAVAGTVHSLLGAVAAVCLWSGEHLVGSESHALTGVLLLMLASMWNAWPQGSAAPVVPRRAPSPGASDPSPDARSV